jgi:hypothetical protein
MLPSSSGSKSKSKKQVIDVRWSGLFVYPEDIGAILFRNVGMATGWAA